MMMLKCPRCGGALSRVRKLTDEEKEEIQRQHGTRLEWAYSCPECSPETFNER